MCCLQQQFFFVFGILPVQAANLPLLDPNFSIVPTECQACPCGAGGLLQLIQNLMNASISLGVIVITLVIAYAGFLFIMSPTNPENRSKARGMIANALIGFIIVLSAWVIVDFIMKILYNDKGTFGPWNKILAVDNPTLCIAVQEASQISGLPGIFSLPINSVGIGGGASSGGGGTGGGAGGPPTPATRGICTPAGLQKYGWPVALAPKMSCVTKYENTSCNASAPSGTDIGADGRSVSIGLFQVNISANDLNSPACTALNGGQPLNCTNAFTGGAYTGSNHSTRVRDARLYDVCRAAASNPSCNTAEAIKIYQKQGIKAWGTAAQKNCDGV